MPGTIIRAALAAVVLQAASGVAAAASDAIYFNANVWTGDPHQPRAEAIAIGDGSIVIIPREGGYLVRLYIELDTLDVGERVASRAITASSIPPSTHSAPGT